MHLITADLSGTIFTHDYTFFEGANLRGANLRYTIWDIDTTSIKGACLEGADLRGAIGLTSEYLSTAYIDMNTKLPKGLNHTEIQILHAMHNMPPARKFSEFEFLAMRKHPIKLPEPNFWP